MKHAKRAPNPARQSGYAGSEVKDALKSMGQSPIGKATKITLRVIWNESEADRDKIVDEIRAAGVNCGNAGDNHAFTFDTDLDASRFKSMVARFTNQKASILAS